jgi:hypothetical protein
VASRCPIRGRGQRRAEGCDLAVDFIDMTSDRRLWTRLQNARPGFVPIAGRHVIAGCEDADPAVARILSVNVDGRIELEVLRGSVDSHCVLLPHDLSGCRFGGVKEGSQG